MSKLHLAPRTCFHEDVQFVNTIYTDETPDASGLVHYLTNSKVGNNINDTLAVSISSKGVYEFRPLIHTITASAGSNITVEQVGGVAMISATGSQGTGDITVYKVTVQKSNVVNGYSYANLGVDLKNGFVYRAYDQNNDSIDGISIVKNANSDNYITMNFGEFNSFPAYVDIIVGTASTAINATSTGPLPQVNPDPQD